MLCAYAKFHSAWFNCGLGDVADEISARPARGVGQCGAAGRFKRRLPMDDLQLSLSAHDAELVGQALDVYATTLLCAPLGLGLDLLVAVRLLRGRLDAATGRHEAVREAADDPGGNVVIFARA